MISKLRVAGAEAVVQHGASWFEADTFLRENYTNHQDAQTDSVNVYVPPFDDPLVWEGAASMITEMAKQLPETNGDGFPADAIVCSVGGGGLFNGIVSGLHQHLACRSEAKPVRVLAVETAGADSLAYSLRSGELSSLKAITSQATSLGALRVAPQAFENARSPPSGVEVSSVVGSDEEAAKGILRLADEMRLQVELACGICVEIAVGGRLKEVIPDLTAQSRVVVVVCGGSNVTAEIIADYRRKIQEGWE